MDKNELAALQKRLQRSRDELDARSRESEQRLKELAELEADVLKTLRAAEARKARLDRQHAGR